MLLKGQITRREASGKAGNPAAWKKKNLNQ